MNVNYVCAPLDASGYAEAARNYIAALDTAGVNVGVVPVSFEQYKSKLGKLGDKIVGLIEKKVTSKIQIIHLTPENYPRLIKPNRYNIAYATWETSKLPAGWADLINKCDEVWVPCLHNIEVFKTSGVTIPIYCVPHTFDEQYVFDEECEESVVGVPQSTYSFYSIFQ